MESVIEFDYNDVRIAWITSNDWNVIRRIRKLAAEHPEEVDIKYQPEENGGFMYGSVPRKWIRIAPPRKVTMTEEEKAAAVERLKAGRKGAKNHENIVRAV